MICQECGMVCEPTEFHPFEACLMFKACHDGDQVRANLSFMRAYAEEAVKQEREACATICDEQAEAHSAREFRNTQAAIGCDGCADAIRDRSRTAVPAKE